MGRRAAEILLAGLLVAGSVRAEAAVSFRQQLEKGNAQLREGNATGALDQYRELLTEDPESPLVHYNMGLAHYGEASQFGGLGSTEDAVAALNKAKEEFENVEKNSPDSKLRVDAAFNHANATAQQAKWAAEAMKSGAGKFEDIIKGFEASVAEYEDMLKRQPDHAGAKQNLDHMRYLLKSMLQNPPPPQEQQQQQQQQQDGENQEQDQQKQEQDQQDKQEQDKQNKQQQEQQAQAEQQQQQQQASQSDKEQQQDQQDQAQNSDNLPEGNTEALLESLEEMDKREQREVKNQQQRGNPAQGNWW